MMVSGLLIFVSGLLILLSGPLVFVSGLTYFDDCATNLFCLLDEFSDPTPAPPLQGRGAATALFAGWESAGTSLPCRGGAGVGSLTIREVVTIYQ